jgi:hypothetical protein
VLKHVRLLTCQHDTNYSHQPPLLLLSAALSTTTGLLKGEMERIKATLPAWHARMATSRKVAQAVKFARDAAAMQHAYGGCEVSIAVGSTAEPVSSSATTSTSSSTRSKGERHIQLRAASQHTLLPEEPLVAAAASQDRSDDCNSSCSTSSSQQHTSLPEEPLVPAASSKDRSDACNSRCSTSSSQQCFAQAGHSYPPAGQQLEFAPATNAAP